MTVKVKLTKTVIARQVADAINAHLVRFETDLKINAPPTNRGTKPYYHANAWGDRHRVRVRYVLYQNHTVLSIEDAARYLAWLDAGNVGQHYRAVEK